MQKHDFSAWKLYEFTVSRTRFVGARGASRRFTTLVPTLIIGCSNGKQIGTGVVVLDPAWFFSEKKRGRSQRDGPFWRNKGSKLLIVPIAMPILPVVMQVPSVVPDVAAIGIPISFVLADVAIVGFTVGPILPHVLPDRLRLHAILAILRIRNHELPPVVPDVAVIRIPIALILADVAIVCVAVAAILV